MEESKNKVFAKGLCFSKVFIFFLLGCLFGSLFEEIIYFFQYGEWTKRYDLIYGPFSTLYGFGVVLYLVILQERDHKRGIIKTFIYCALLGGVAEYIASLFLELFLNIKFWDYSNMFLNFGGRTSIPVMIIWGIEGTILLKLIYPFLSKLIEKIPFKVGRIVCILLLILIILDIIVSYSAFIRMIYRNKGSAPKTKIGEIYDQIYNDDFMYQRFPILKGKL